LENGGLTLSLKNVTTPDLGGAADVSVIEILVKPGDSIQADTSIVTLESDKATMEVPAGDAGTVKEIKVKVGDKLAADAVILTLEVAAGAAEPVANPASSSPADATPKAGASAVASATPPVKSQPQPATTAPEKSITVTTDTEQVHAGPGVRRMARELGVNLAQVSGSGPKQRIMKEDIQQYVKAQLSQSANGQAAGFALPAAPVVDFAKFGPIETTALSRIKKISGKNLQRNWISIPHVTQFADADITTLEHFRQAQKAEMDKQKIKLTPLVFIMKAVVVALRAFPNFNASLDVSGENLILKHYFHIGVAVDTPDGLVVPVIRDVDKKGLVELAKELAEVSEKARKKQLTPGDMQGGCFSISSLGGIGGTAFTPIINAPEVAILGVSKSVLKPVYQDGIFVPRLMLPLSLSYDHRVIDGAEGARFIVHLSQTLSDIRNLLL
jgi:pyruvate dehydrogenase E2 component (dihydrolipoamide acetyltransferase)